MKKKQPTTAPVLSEVSMRALNRGWPVSAIWQGSHVQEPSGESDGKGRIWIDFKAIIGMNLNPI